MFVGSPGTTVTAAPASSARVASSLASPPPAWARRSTPAANAWGVCTATRSRRSTASPPTRRMLSPSGTAGSTASAPSSTASTTAANSAGLARGRAASWTTIDRGVRGDRRRGRPGPTPIASRPPTAVRSASTSPGSVVPGGSDDDDAVAAAAGRVHRPPEDAASRDQLELLGPAEAEAGAGRHHDRPDRHDVLLSDPGSVRPS